MLLLLKTNNGTIFLKKGKWEQAMMEDDAVKATYLKPEIHAKYREMRREGGAVDYNFLYSKK